MAKRKNTVGRAQALVELNGWESTVYTLNERTTEFLGKRRDLLGIFYKGGQGWIVTTKAKAFLGDSTGFLHKLGSGDTEEIADDELKKAPYVEAETLFLATCEDLVYALNEKTMDHPDSGGLGKSVVSLGLFWRAGEGYCVTTKAKAKKRVLDKDCVAKFGDPEDPYVEEGAEGVPKYIDLEYRAVTGVDTTEEMIYVTRGINPADDPYKEKTVFVRYTATYVFMLLFRLKSSAAFRCL
jgi:hypothetical protein